MIMKELLHANSWRALAMAWVDIRCMQDSGATGVGVCIYRARHKRRHNRSSSAENNTCLLCLQSATSSCWLVLQEAAHTGRLAPDAYIASPSGLGLLLTFKLVADPRAGRNVADI